MSFREAWWPRPERCCGLWLRGEGLRVNGQVKFPTGGQVKFPTWLGWGQGVGPPPRVRMR